MNSQRVLKLIMTYGWAILIVVIVGAVFWQVCIQENGEHPFRNKKKIKESDMLDGSSKINVYINGECVAGGLSKKGVLDELKLLSRGFYENKS